MSKEPRVKKPDGLFLRWQCFVDDSMKGLLLCDDPELFLECLEDALQGVLKSTLGDGFQGVLGTIFKRVELPKLEQRLVQRRRRK